jgi:hypothetical protein
MARLYAQVCTVAFLILGIGGWFVGDAGHVVDHRAQGNVDGMVLHLTYGRDVLDLVLLAGFVAVGFVVGPRAGRLILGLIGLVLVGLAALGFAIGDTAAGTRSLASLHFPLAINVFDLVVGVLAVITALGPAEEEAASS